MYLLGKFFKASDVSPTPSLEVLKKEREEVYNYVQGDGGDGSGVTWKDKAMSPIGLGVRESDGKSILALDKPGPELKDSGRVGDTMRVVLVKFGKDGPRMLSVAMKAQVLEEIRKAKAKAAAESKL